MAESRNMTLTHDCRILILTFNSQIKLWKDWNPSERTYFSSRLQRWFANPPTKQNACFYLNICIYVLTKQCLTCKCPSAQCDSASGRLLPIAWVWRSREGSDVADSGAADAVVCADWGGTELNRRHGGRRIKLCVSVCGREKVWINLSENHHHLAMVMEGGKIHNFSSPSHTD